MDLSFATIIYPNANPTKPPNSCSSGPPWLFKSFQSVASLTSTVVDLISKPQTITLNQFSSGMSKTTRTKGLSGEEQGELEQRALACALADGKEATVIEFYSPNCSLCNSMVDFVGHVENKNADWLNIVMADAENDKWLPEVSVRYIGKLKKNEKIFDSNIGKAQFKFRLSVGQVISGWDVGVKGMCVGD